MSENKVKELEEKLAIYEGDHAADFYKVLVGALKSIKSRIENKTLNLDDDEQVYEKSVLTIFDKAPKIFEGLKAGKAAFIAEEQDTKGKKVGKAKAEEHGGRVGV